MTYEVRACPFCGAQAEYGGGWEGEGWTFKCEHQAYSAEYGEVEPLTFSVEVPDVDEALAVAALRLEERRSERAEEQAARQRAEAERRAALTPEQRDAEDRRQAMTTQALSNLTSIASPLVLTRQHSASDSAVR